MPPGADTCKSQLKRSLVDHAQCRVSSVRLRHKDDGCANDSGAFSVLRPSQALHRRAGQGSARSHQAKQRRRRVQGHPHRLVLAPVVAQLGLFQPRGYHERGEQQQLAEDGLALRQPRQPRVGRPASDKLEGWLLKRHTSEKTIGAQWARRYPHVNELARGTLSMSKGPTKTASAVLSLIEIKSVMVSERSNETGRNCFVISCPPVHLTVRADSPEECRMWVRQLRLRADAWRAKSNPVVSARVAGTAELQGASPSSSPSLPSQGHVEYESAAERDSAAARSRAPHDDAAPTAARSPNKGRAQRVAHRGAPNPNPNPNPNHNPNPNPYPNP